MLCSNKRFHNSFALISLIRQKDKIKYRFVVIHENIKDVFPTYEPSKNYNRKATYWMCFSTVIISFCKVTSCVVKPADWRNAISATSSTFLVIRLQTLWAAIVYHMPYVWFINTHTKSDSCNHDIELVSDKWSAKGTRISYILSLVHSLRKLNFKIR